MNAKKTLKVAGSVAGAAVMVGSALAVAPMAALAYDADAPESAGLTAAADQEANRAGGAQKVAADRLTGDFAYDQGVLTSNKDVTATFNKAAATLCQSLPMYGSLQACETVQVRNLDANAVLEASLDELAEQADTENLVIGCACSTNTPGGGAIVNADVQGVSLASVAALVAAI